MMKLSETISQRLSALTDYRVCLEVTYDGGFVMLMMDFAKRHPKDPLRIPHVEVYHTATSTVLRPSISNRRPKKDLQEFYSKYDENMAKFFERVANELSRYDQIKISTYELSVYPHHDQNDETELYNCSYDGCEQFVNEEPDYDAEPKEYTYRLAETASELADDLMDFTA